VPYEEEFPKGANRNPPEECPWIPLAGCPLLDPSAIENEIRKEEEV